MSFEYLIDPAKSRQWTGLLHSDLLNTGDFGYVPTGFAHGYPIEEAAHDHPTKDQPPAIPDFPRMRAAAERHDMRLLRGFAWSGTAA